jgi:hypothetical protein
MPRRGRKSRSRPSSIPVVRRLSQRCHHTLSSDHTLVPNIVRLVSNLSQAKDPHTFRAVKISFPGDRSPVNTVRMQINFKRMIAIKGSMARSERGLFVIPLALRPSDRPSAPGQTDKSPRSSRVHRARWDGPDLVPSAATEDRGDIFDDETLSNKIAT